MQSWPSLGDRKELSGKDTSREQNDEPLEFRQRAGESYLLEMIKLTIGGIRILSRVCAAPSPFCFKHSTTVSEKTA